MNEIQRLQQLAGILTEIKINRPVDYEKIWDESWEDAIDKIGEWDEDSELENEDEISSLARETFKERTGKEYDDINEDVSGFNVGQTKQSDGHKSTVTDVDPTTQSVTWNITKELGDKEIWDDLTKIIRKFETVQVKDFHSRPKLIQLIKDLKTIRNKFSRTVVKEDLRILKENLIGILNEIKVNNPNIPKVYLDNNQPYIILKDGSKFYGYLRDDEDSFTFEKGGYNSDEEFDEVVKYFGDRGELIGDGGLEYIIVYGKDVNMK